MRCQWLSCQGNLVPKCDDMGRQIGWKCLMCSRSTDMKHEMEIKHKQEKVSKRKEVRAIEVINLSWAY
jgi:hypothetical protein